MAKRTEEQRIDQAVEDSFPASDPPANSGITGPRTKRPDEAGDDARPKGRPTDDRHATETAYQRVSEKKPQ